MIYIRRKLGPFVDFVSSNVHTILQTPPTHVHTLTRMIELTFSLQFCLLFNSR